MKREKGRRTGNDNIAQAQHAELHRINEEVLWPQQFDRCVEGLRHGHHHICSKDPEDVVKEETALKWEGELVRS